MAIRFSDRVAWIFVVGILKFSRGQDSDADNSQSVQSGSRFTINPILTVPLIRNPMLPIYSEFRAQIPFTIRIEQLLTQSLMMMGGNGGGKTKDSSKLPSFSITNNPVPRDLKRLFSNSSYPNDILVDEMETKSRCKLSASHRVEILDYTENLVQNIFFARSEPPENANIKNQCILRSICEINMFEPENLGFYGEVIKLLFKPSTLRKCKRDSEFLRMLRDYIEAEENGSTKFDCSMYDKRCSFTRLF